MVDNNLSIDAKVTISGTYLLAGIPVAITTLYKQLHTMCADYRTQMAPELFVETSLDDISEERSRNEEEGNDCSQFSNGYVETLVVYRKVALLMLDKGVLLMHGSCISVDGNGILFTANSGTGKSTHTRLWSQMLGEKVVMVNDDKPLIAVSNDSAPVVYGTPWDGKHHLSNNISVPLKAIVYLQRGNVNTIHSVSPQDMLQVLLEQTFSTDDVAVTIKVLDLLDKLSRNTSFYHMHCNMEIEAAEIAYKTIMNL